MKTSIKTTIGIIAIAIGSMSIAQAGEHRNKRDNDRHYDKPRQERNYHRSERRNHTKHMNHRRDHFREQRRFRKQKRFNRHAKRHFRAYKRARRHYGWKHGYRAGWKRGHYNYTGYDYDSYVSPRYYVSPRHSSHVSVSGDEIPVLAGTLIGSAIASDVSDGNPVATFGGAVIGAIIGNQIAHH